MESMVESPLHTNRLHVGLMQARLKAEDGEEQALACRPIAI